MSCPTRALDRVHDDAIAAIQREREAGKKSTVVAMPTGTGKTVMFCRYGKRVVEQGGRVLIVAQRKELLEQAGKRWTDWTGLPYAIEQADRRADWYVTQRQVPCVIACTATLHERRMRNRWARDTFDTIITDECHHGTSSGHRAIFDHFQCKFHLGVSATPFRSDGTNLGEIYEGTAFSYGLDEAIDAKHLVEVEAIQANVQVDLRGLNMTKGDWRDSELHEALCKDLERLANAVRQIVKQEGIKQLIAFVPKVRTAYLFAQALSEVGKDDGLRARAVDGKSKNRDSILRDFAKGGFEVLVNCALLTEGYDAPFVDGLVFLRPTRSLVLFMQMLGRGLRTWPGKTRCRVIDFAWLFNQHRPLSVVDAIVPARVSREIRDRAAEILREGKERDVKNAIDQAEIEDWRMSEERLWRAQIAARRREIDMTIHCFNPLDGEPLREPAFALAPPRIFSGATPKQIAFLRRIGMDQPDRLTKDEASREIAKTLSRFQRFKRR